MKLLIIGAGAVAELTHIPAAINIVGKENIFIAEHNKQQADRMIAKFGLLNENFSPDYKQLLEKVDAVILATPPHNHNQILSDCIKVNIPVLCEKPLSENAEQSRHLLDDIREGLVLGLCHTYRLFPNRIKVKKMIEDGYFGDKVFIDIQEGNPAAWPTLSGYCFRKDMVPGGVLFDAGIHSLDFILWCLGSPKQFEYEDDAWGGLESNVKIKLSCEKGNASFRISRTSSLSNKITVSGNNKTVVLDVFEMNKLSEDDVVSFVKEDNSPDWGNIGEYQLKNFIGAVKYENPLICSFKQGLNVIENIEKFYASSKKKNYNKNPLGGYKNKRVLVTGGSGFIGSLLTERLVLDEEANVSVMVHSWPKAAWVSRLKVDLIKADITNYEEVEKALEGCEIVFHCVGVGGTLEQTKNINVRGTENVLKACDKKNIKRMVYFSSVVVHGDKIKDGMNEKSPFVSYGDNYADTKIEAENVLWDFIKNQRLNVSVIRPTYVWGPRSQWYSIEIVKQMKENKFFLVDEGNGSCNAVYIGNLIDLSLICGVNTKAIGQVFLITDNEKITWGSFFGYYAKMLNKDIASFKSIPLKDGTCRIFLKYSKKKLNKIVDDTWKVVLKNEDKWPFLTKWGIRAPRKVAKLLLESLERNLPEKTAADMAIYKHKGFIDIAKSKELLNYQPRFTVEEGMKITLQWLEKENYL